jgi:hypothetical protein
MCECRRFFLLNISLQCLVLVNWLASTRPSLLWNTLVLREKTCLLVGRLGEIQLPLFCVHTKHTPRVAHRVSERVHTPRAASLFYTSAALAHAAAAFQPSSRSESLSEGGKTRLEGAESRKRRKKRLSARPSAPLINAACIQLWWNFTHR